MYILFLLLHIAFALLAYFSGGTILSIVFLLLGFASFFWFSPFQFFRKAKNSEVHDIVANSDSITRTVKSGIISFFQNSVLGVSLTLFHLALVIAVYSLEQTIGVGVSDFIFGVGACMGMLFVIAKFYKSQSFFHFAYLNLTIYSFFLGVTAVYFFSESSIFWFIPILLVSVSWFFSLWYPVGIQKSELYTGVFVGLFFLILFLEKVLYTLFPDVMLLTTVSMLAILCIVFFEVVILRGFIQIRTITRMISLFVSYIAVLFLGYYSIVGNGYSIIFLIIQLLFQIYVHRKYENYPSLLFSSIIPLFIYSYFFPFPETFLLTLVHALCIFLVLTFLGRIIRTGYKYDEYVFQTVALGTMFVLLSLYVFRYGKIDMLEISGILLLFSSAFFVSYFQIRK